MNMTTKRKIKQGAICAAIIYALLELSGLKYRLYEKNYFTDFEYPMYSDVRRFVEEILDSSKVSIKPPFSQDIQFTLNNQDKCYVDPEEKLRLVYIVKSAVKNVERRTVIRKTWGFERRFSDVNIRTVFLLGQDDKLEEQVKAEHEEYGDIVQGRFVDSYYNNTIKTMMGLKWAKEFCSSAKFFMFVDDDYYVSTRNMLRFLRNPVNYPKYLEDPTISFDEVQKQNSRKLQQLVDFELPEDVVFYAGFVMFRRPQRHWFGKWSVSIEEYPFHMYPPYVTAGAYVLSNSALKKFYYATLYVKPYIFDDIYLGIVAKKLGIEPFHCPEFWFHRKYPYQVKDFRYTLASHEFSDHRELETVWNQQKQAGNA